MDKKTRELIRIYQKATSTEKYKRNFFSQKTRFEDLHKK